ncbi:hypothetical protein DEO23_01350 [Brachybacterium endophyticum]|uniref:DUF402 domain-containing protein n=1 Tax=Brachybacterium endophyticum TaxID=2182385 RepID=A0A2U2RNG7_9MICO|nr:DUF402 domain-containing protein [Brachybacterium endophyticum]PWH07324.1 hypothetical protein DEO23_01350 [Brachybacterium endophyticum]
MDPSIARSFGTVPAAPGAVDSRPHAPGAHVVQRSVRDFVETGPAVGFAVGGMVLEDTRHHIVLMTVPGSGMAGRNGPGSGPSGRLVAPGDWDGSYRLGAWRGTTVVRVHCPGENWSVWRWHDGADWTRQWYGNLEAPWRRTPLGYDMQDWALDVVAQGDPATEDWQVAMKDEDELEWLVERGVASREVADRIIDTGRELRGLFERREGAVGEDWSAWVPPAGAAPVDLPCGWQELDAAPRR